MPDRHHIPSGPGLDDPVTVVISRDDLASLLNEMWGKLGWEAPVGAGNALTALRTAYLASAAPSSAAPSLTAPLDDPLHALAAFLRSGQRWKAGRLVSSSCPSQADICAALGWPPPWGAAWAPAPPGTPAETQPDGCMPHRRLPCGHCPHQVCQDCDRCCSCQCGQLIALSET